MTSFLALTLLVLSSKAAVATALLGAGALGMSWLTDEPFMKLLAGYGIVDKVTGLVTVIKNLSVQAASYAVLGTEPSGTVFTTTGAAGAVTFTLPAVAAKYKGWSYTFRNAANQNMIVAGTAGQIIALNNAAATSLAASTANQKIGAVIDAFCDGAAWHLSGPTVGVTYTVA